MAYCTKRISPVFIPSCQSKEAAVTHYTVCYSFVTILINWLLFDISVHDASVYLTTISKMHVLSLDKPSMKHGSHSISFSRMLFLCSIVVRCYPLAVPQRT